MKRLWMVVVSLLVFSTTVNAASVEDYAMKAEKIADGVWAIISPARDFPNKENRGWNSNSAFVDTGEALLVFDSGSSETIGNALIETIRSVSDKPIRWVINSHSHGDHWLGNGAFEASGVEIISSDVVKELIEKDGYMWVDRFNNMTGGITGQSKVVAPNATVTEPVSRTFGNTTVEVLFSGNAHSPGDIVFWLPQKSVLLSGDVMYTGRPPATFDSNVQAWIDFLGELEALDPKVMVPGHGKVGGGDDITNLKNYFETLWAAVAEGYEAGKMDYEMKEDVQSRMQQFESIFPGIDERVGESISHVYLQVEAALF